MTEFLRVSLAGHHGFVTGDIKLEDAFKVCISNKLQIYRKVELRAFRAFSDI